VGKEYVDMTDISRQGDGIAGVQGRQKVKIRVNQVGNRFATAAIVS
jgi:predicted RNA-binding protein with TRAM domain